MKWIKYNICTTINHSSEEEPRYEEVLTPAALEWSEANEAIAKREAHNGEYLIEDDAQEETHLPTDAERIAVLEEQLAAAKILLGVE